MTHRLSFFQRQIGRCEGAFSSNLMKNQFLIGVALSAALPSLT